MKEMILVHILRILLDYLGMTQAELSQKTGVMHRDLGDMIHKPPFGQITKYKKVADYLGIPVHAIVFNDPSGIPLSFFENHSPKAYLPPVNTKVALLGRLGEEEVFRLEQERLQLISPVLAKLVIPYFKARKKSPGYDILSYSEDSSPIAIEVKSTPQKDSDSCRLTKHEQETAEKLTSEGIDYKIYFLTGVGTEEQDLSIVDYRELKAEKRVEPVSYLCNFRKRKPFVNGILYYRLINNLSQIELARIIEILPGNLCRYETGMYVCPVEVYQKLSALFRVSIDDLLKDYPRPVAGE